MIQLVRAQREDVVWAMNDVLTGKGNKAVHILGRVALSTSLTTVNKVQREVGSRFQTQVTENEPLSVP